MPRFPISEIQLGSSIFDIKDAGAARASDVERLLNLLESGSLVAYPIIWNLSSDYTLVPTRLQNYYFAMEAGLTFKIRSNGGQPETDITVKYNGTDVTQNLLDDGSFVYDQDTKIVTLVLEDPGVYEISS